MRRWEYAPRVPATRRPSPLVRTVLGVEPVRDALVATFLTNPRFTRNLLQAFIHDPAHATDARVAIYRQPLALQEARRQSGNGCRRSSRRERRGERRPRCRTGSSSCLCSSSGATGHELLPRDQGQRLAQIAPKAELHVMTGRGPHPADRRSGGIQRAIAEMREWTEVAIRDPGSGISVRTLNADSWILSLRVFVVERIAVPRLPRPHEIEIPRRIRRCRPLRARHRNRPSPASRSPIWTYRLPGCRFHAVLPRFLRVMPRENKSSEPALQESGD
jgi:hypothetical protein